jgi:DNA polymerase III epsilon subunit-like protein
MCDRDGIDPKLACQKTVDFIGNDIVIGLNNIAFDFQFLEVESNKHGIQRPKIETWFDVGTWHKGIQLGHMYNEQEPYFKYSTRIRDIRARIKFNLDFLSKTYGVENLRDDGKHGALKDLHMTKNVFDKMKEKYCA